MKKVFLSSIVLSAAVLVSGVCATVRLVPAEYPSIQQAIIDSNDGDMVIVSPGVYYETINFSGKDIVLTSTDPNDPKIVGYTVINAEEDGTVVTFENGESSGAVLTGFTITGGIGTLGESYGDTYKFFYGGGIYCPYGSPTITHNVIVNNHLPYVDEQRGNQWYYEISYGGGVYCSGGSVTVTHNVIRSNSAYSGGGLYVSSGTVANNIIYDNSGAYGGGVYVYGGQFVNNTVVRNDCSVQPDWGMGGNVFAGFSYNDNLIVANNIICGAESGGGLYYSLKPRTDLIRFNNVWNNTPANYGMQDQRTGETILGAQVDWTGQFGNISQDPRFADAWNNNYHITSDSPCVSAGDPAPLAGSGVQDIDGDPRVFALRVDMGADEYVGYVKPLAQAGADQHVLAPEPVTLDGTNSYTSDQSTARTYLWAQKEGPAAALDDPAAAQPTFTPPAPGWYVFQLVVADDQYTSQPDEVLVVVGNEQPVADAGPDQIRPVGDYARLDGSGSHDADPPDQLTYTWTQVEGPDIELWNAGSSTAYFICDTPGIYVFELVVHDGFVAGEPDTVKVQVSPFTRSVEVAVETDYVDGYHFHPSAAGTKIAYAGGSYQDTSWDIHCLDTRTGEDQVFGGDGTDTRPRMDGNLIVWSGGPTTYYAPVCTSVFLVDVTTSQVQTLRRATLTDSYGYPAISGGKAVWLQHRGVNTRSSAQYEQQLYDICGADVTDPTSPVYFTVAEKAGRCIPYPYSNFDQEHTDFVDISGNIVVWEGNGDIYGADVSDLNHIKVFPICSAPERQYDPSIWGHRVVWTDEREDIGDIYGADISDPNNIREFKVYAGPGWQLQPDIDGAMIVFLDGDDYYGNLRVCCISREYGIVNVPLPQPQDDYISYYGSGPQIDGMTLVWQYGEQLMGTVLGLAYGVAEGPVRNLTTGEQYDYIQHGIEAAVDGDVIVVQEGTYREKLRFRGRDITVTSTNPQDRHVRAATVLEGPGQLVTFADGEDADSVLAGLTITGGSFGVYCSGSTPLITDCVITDNSFAGVKLWDRANPTLARSEITANGMGMEMWSIRIGRQVRRNDAALRNCLVAGNRKDGVWGGWATIENCTIAENGGYGANCSMAMVANSIIYFNHGAENLRVESVSSGVTYSDIEGGWEGEGNIDADPLFVRQGTWTSLPSGAIWEAGDYHLKSEGWTFDTPQSVWTWYDVTSLCIDAGDPSLLIGEEPPCGAGDPLSERAGPNARINMGAYGGTAEASLAPVSSN